MRPPLIVAILAFILGADSVFGLWTTSSILGAIGIANALFLAWLSGVYFGEAP